ncbi:MAG: tetratricopeptide repeat protein [Dehalococcoidales bacterium]|nr:tetratricopeptide repeat protein [Dehalococcoidales bacterium]
MSNGTERLEAWKTFLRGRIEQEKGNHEGALKAFDTALKIDPANPAFLTARGNALAKLGKPEEAMVSQLVASYSKLAVKLTGKNDKADTWVAGLEQMLKKAETLDKKSILVDMCW